MTEREVIKYLEQHGMIADEVKDMAIQALEKQSMVNEILNEARAYRAIGTVEEFKALKEKKEKGLLLELPCKIGDDVFFIPSKPNFYLNILHRQEAFNRVYHQKIARIHIAEEHWYLEGNLNLEYGIDRLFVDKEYKEVWFLTREEAEQALANMQKA